MLKFTLDTNCIIALEKNEPTAGALRGLLAKHHDGAIALAVVSVSAAERQPGDRFIDSFEEFEALTHAVGLNGIPVLQGIGFYGLSYWGRGLYPSMADSHRDQQIHQALFPNIPYELADFAAQNGIPVDTKSLAVKPWRNAFCDRQMYWAHDHAQQDVFVTSDLRFGKKLIGHPDFPTARISTPDEAILLV